MKALNISGWVLFILLSIGIGLYPWGYLISEVLAENGLLSSKLNAILESTIWNIQFYIHIFLGSVAMLTGWSQFIKKWRNKNIGFHRILGKIYIIACILSGLAGFYIGYFAEGGIVAQTGFMALAVVWLYTTSKAYFTIRKKNVDAHRKWMIRSYALTWAAVTLRLWLPLFQFGLGMEFIPAYVIIAWLCWVPNLVWAEWKIKRLSLS